MESQEKRENDICQDAPVSPKRSMREEMEKLRCRLVTELSNYEMEHVRLESNSKQQMRKLTYEQKTEMNCLRNKISSRQVQLRKIEAILGCLKALPRNKVTDTLKNTPSAPVETHDAPSCEPLSANVSATTEGSGSNGVAESLQNAGIVSYSNTSNAPLKSADSLVSTSAGVSVPIKIENIESTTTNETAAVVLSKNSGGIDKSSKNCETNVKPSDVADPADVETSLARDVSDSSKNISSISDVNAALDEPHVETSLGGDQTELLEKVDSNLLSGAVRRQSAIEVEETEEELEYRRACKIELIPREHLKCTKCTKHLTSGNRHLHPLLKVLFCGDCKDYYCDGEFSHDEDGDDKYCRWCGQWEKLLYCARCVFAFCTECIKYNLGDIFRQLAEEDDNWNCFVCNPWPMWELRHIAAIAMASSQEFDDAESVEKQAKKISKTAGMVKFKKKKAKSNGESTNDAEIIKPDGKNETLDNNEDLMKTMKRTGKNRKRIYSGSSDDGDEYGRNAGRFKKGRSSVIQGIRYGLRRRLGSDADNKIAHEKRYKMRKRKRSCSSDDEKGKKELCSEDFTGCNEGGFEGESKQTETSRNEEGKMKPSKEEGSLAEASNDEVRRKSSSTTIVDEKTNEPVDESCTPKEEAEPKSKIGSGRRFRRRHNSESCDEKSKPRKRRYESDSSYSMGKENRRSRRLQQNNSLAVDYYYSNESEHTSGSTWSEGEDTSSSSGETTPSVDQKFGEGAPDSCMDDKRNKYRRAEVQCGPNEYLRPFLNLSALTSDLVAEMCIKKLEKISQQQSRVGIDTVKRIQTYLSILTGGVSLLRKIAQESLAKMSDDEE